MCSPFAAGHSKNRICDCFQYSIFAQELILYLIQIISESEAVWQISRMKTAWPHIEALLLCICIMLYGMASDAGTNMGVGAFEMVICSGDGPISVVIDSNGNPVPSDSKCCDCLTCGTPIAALATGAFQLSASPARFSNFVISITDQIPTPPHTTRPQALGPPSATRKNGVSAMLGCGSVFKDTAA